MLFCNFDRIILFTVPKSTYPNVYIHTHIYIYICIHIYMYIRVAHIKKLIAEDWGLADGIYIPKEKNSKHLEEFRPISMLNIEGKIFFGVIAKRMMRFVLNNKFFNISIQKAGIPGFPGCIEHASML